MLCGGWLHEQPCQQRLDPLELSLHRRQSRFHGPVLLLAASPIPFQVHERMFAQWCDRFLGQRSGPPKLAVCRSTLNGAAGERTPLRKVQKADMKGSAFVDSAYHPERRWDPCRSLPSLRSWTCSRTSPTYAANKIASSTAW